MGIVLGVFLEIKMLGVFCLETEVLLITKTETFLRRIIITSTREQAHVYQMRNTSNYTIFKCRIERPLFQKAFVFQPH